MRAKQKQTDPIRPAPENESLPGLNNLKQDLVRVEKNLQAIGFFSPSKSQQTASRTVSHLVKHPDGRRIQARAVITAPQELGLPTTADRDKYMALMKIILDRRSKDGIVDNPIRFTGYELLKLLRLSLAGYHYEEIEEWLKRMTATTIMSESIVFLADRKEYASDIFHVFDMVNLSGHERPDGTRADEYEVYLSRWQLQNINSGYLLQMDLNAYLELRRDIGKALFGHLHVWFYASRGRTIEKDYNDFCELLHIKAWPHLSKIKQILEPPMEELMAIGYLSAWDVVRALHPGRFKVILSPGSRLLETPALAGVQARLRDTGINLPGWVKLLAERGVQESVARQMALDIDEEQPIEKQIAYIDYLVSSAPQGKIKNPPGLYVALVRDNIPVPPAYGRQHRRWTATRPETVNDPKPTISTEAELEYQQYRLERIRQYLDAQISPQERRRRVGEKIKGIRHTYPHLPDDTVREIAEGMLLRDAGEEILLPTLEDYTVSRQQLTIFPKEGA